MNESCELFDRPEQLRNLLGAFDVVPLSEQILSDIDFLALYKQLEATAPIALLESGDQSGSSYLAWGEIEQPFALDCQLAAGAPSAASFADVFSGRFSRSIYDDGSMSGLVGGFLAGGIGYLSYDAVRRIEELPSHAECDLKIPHAWFFFPRFVLVRDHSAGTLRLTCLLQEQDCGDLEQLKAEFLELRTILIEASDQAEVTDLANESRSTPTFEAGMLHPDRATFASMVNRAIEHLRAGDIFQVNLSIRYERKSSIPAHALYSELRRVNPSPYMSLIADGSRTIIGASPELLFSIHGSRVETRPIAGTRRRAGAPDEEAAKERELLSDPKERAEHLMLVDLERNDLGRVSEYGTVEVDELLTIERYSHVIHLVSNVVGRLRPDVEVPDVLAAMFPGGTITGAPKIRSMEIIDELEPRRRGIYTGSVGWIDFRGDAMFNIVIRTILQQEGVLYAQAGAGIVVDSIAEREFDESIKKLRASVLAIERAIDRHANDRTESGA